MKTCTIYIDFHVVEKRVDWESENLGSAQTWLFCWFGKNLSGPQFAPHLNHESNSY